MRILKVSIAGYRSLRSVEIELADLTACIGPNGSGKSSLLGALRLFFQPSSEVAQYDFWAGVGDERADHVSIKVKFGDLDDDEREAFGQLLDDQTELLTVERRFEEPGKGVYLARRLAVPEFSRIRMLERSHRDEYNELVLTNQFEGLPRATSKDDAFARMAAWEESHPDRCEMRDEEVDVMSEILEAFTFVSIGAFDDPSEHVEAEGQGAVSRLLSRVVDEAQVQTQLQAVADQASGDTDRILEDATEGFDDFARLMEESLGRFAPGSRLAVKWIKPELKSTRPRLRVDVETSDGLATPLEYQGHGVQRALMYAALTAQAQGPASDTDRIVLLIEEPEAFQHPLSCRVLANTLRELSGRNYQIAYSTHSPFFIHPSSLEGLRIFHREDADGRGASTTIDSLTGEQLLAEWERVFEGEGFTIESVLARLKSHLPSPVLEGLFARACILVEGAEDEAVVRGAALQHGLDLDASGLAVIQTNGKTGMPNVLTFFSMAGIPSYPVFDLDRGKPEEDQHREAERQTLLALMAEETEPTPGVHETYAAWEEDLTAILREDIGGQYEELLVQASGELGYAPSRGRKVPTVVASLIGLAGDEGIDMPTLSSISERISRLVEALT